MAGGEIHGGFTRGDTAVGRRETSLDEQAGDGRLFQMSFQWTLDDDLG
jgi:hypothetical protein